VIKLAEKAVAMDGNTNQVKKRLVRETIKVSGVPEAVKILVALIKKFPVDNFGYSEYPEYDKKTGKPTGKIKRELSVSYKTSVPVTETIVKWFIEKEGLK